MIRRWSFQWSCESVTSVRNSSHISAAFASPLKQIPSATELVRRLRLPSQLSALECRDAEIDCGEIGNLTIVGKIVDGEIRLFAEIDGADAMLSPERTSGIHGRRHDRFRGCHSHL